MAKKYTDGIVFASAFSPSGSQPLDNRTVVKSFSDLINETTFGDTKYDGMVVAVLDDQQTYMLIDSKNSTQESSWKKLGADESPIGIGDTENSAVLKGGNNQVISEGGVALGKDNIVGLKGWYINDIYTNDGGKYYNMTISSKNTELGDLVEDSDFNCTYEEGDIISIQIGSIFTNIGRIETIHESDYGHHIFFSSLKYFSLPQSDPEKRYYLWVLSKPNAGVVDLGQNAISYGLNNQSLSECAYAEGKNNKAFGKYAHVEGKENEAHYCSHAEGSNNIALGNTSHAEGTDNRALNSNTHVEGRYTSARGYASHAEGYGESVEINTEASGEGAHAEGRVTKAQGNYSHTEGQYTSALGIASHAEGKGESQTNPNKAEGNYSHVEGEKTKAIGVASHSEGMMTEAIGKAAHSEGRQTKTTNDYTHAEGYLSESGGIGSHAEGVGTQTKNNGEHAEGRFNKSNSVAPNEGSNPKNTLHSVGIGTSDTDRTNAHEIMQDGKHYILGIGNYDGKKLDGATDVATVINNKADKTYVSKEINDRINVIISGAPETFDTLKEIADYIAEDKEGAVDMVSKISKVTTRVETLETDKADIDEVEKAKKVSEDIIIAGGPLADFALSVFPDGKIPSGTTFQDLFMTLLCQNIYPEVTTNTDEVKYKVEIPSFSISATGASNNDTVEIGTSITFGLLTAKNVTVTKTNPQVSGFTHGYSDSLTGDIVNENSIITEWTVNNISGGTFTLTASSSKFSGTLPTKAENAVYSSCKLSGCTLTVTEGENKYTVTESAPQQIGSHNGIPSKFIVSNLGKRENGKISEAIASETDVKKTPANKSATFTVTGVYPIYTNGVSASTVDSTAATMDGLIEPVEGDGTKLPLVKNGVKFAVSFASQTQAPYTLFVPQGMKITEAYAIDEFVNTYSVDCLNNFKLSNTTTTRTVQNNTVTYSIYEWSGTNGANRVRFTVGK